MSIVDNDIVDEIMPEFDPTNPDADYGEVVRVGGDAAINALTGGAAGNAFSQASQGIEDLNELTDNTFTAENIGEMTENLGSMAEEATEQVSDGVTEVASNIVEDLFGSLF